MIHKIALETGDPTAAWLRNTWYGDESNDLFIHMINVPEGFEARESIEAKEIFGLFDCPAWIRRIAE